MVFFLFLVWIVVSLVGPPGQKFPRSHVPQEYYSNDTNADRIKRVQTQIAEVKDVMVDNIGSFYLVLRGFVLCSDYCSLDKVLARGERIELLVDKTNELSSSALSFQKQSVSLKRSMWFKNIKIMIVIGVLVVVRGCPSCGDVSD